MITFQKNKNKISTVFDEDILRMLGWNKKKKQNDISWDSEWKSGALFTWSI